MKLRFILVLSFLISGCVGKFNYVPPDVVAPLNNFIEIEKSRSELWKELIPKLGKNFYVINNLDQSSGLINITYTGDPESYIDCGTMNSYVSNMKGEREYKFPASRASQQYEVMKDNTTLFNIDRKMSLEGRMNLILEDIGPQKTRLTVNTRYILTRVAVILQAGTQIPANFTDTVSFNSGQSASFPQGNPKITCQPNGKLEETVLSLVKR